MTDLESEAMTKTTKKKNIPVMTWIWIHITKWRENNVLTGTHPSMHFCYVNRKTNILEIKWTDRGWTLDCLSANTFTLCHLATELRCSQTIQQCFEWIKYKIKTFILPICALFKCWTFWLTNACCAASLQSNSNVFFPTSSKGNVKEKVEGLRKTKREVK